MKKLISMYQKYMFRPILYKSVTRVSVVAVLMLLCLRMHIRRTNRNNRRSTVVNYLTLTVAALAQRFRQQLHVPFAQRFQAHAVRHEHFNIASSLIGHEFQ